MNVMLAQKTTSPGNFMLYIFFSENWHNRVKSINKTYLDHKPCFSDLLPNHLLLGGREILKPKTI